MDSKFFTFIKPYLAYIDNGKLFRKPFNWLYIIMALFNLYIPFYILYVAIDNGVFGSHGEAKVIFGFLLAWLIIAFACWIGFQLWWNRKDIVEKLSAEKDEFTATPPMSHFIQTLGEWLGIGLGLIGFLFGLLSIIALGDVGKEISRESGIGFLGAGIWSVILSPIYGFLIIAITRFWAEQIRVLITIAKNTKKK